MTKRSSLSHEKSRLKDLLWLLIQQQQPLCPICNQPFIRSDVLPSRGVDQLTEHHVNGWHHDNRLDNRVLVHRECHKRYHSKDNINFWRQFR